MEKTIRKGGNGREMGRGGKEEKEQEKKIKTADTPPSPTNKKKSKASFKKRAPNENK